MIQKSHEIVRSVIKPKPYERIVQRMRDLFNGQITDKEAHEAARTLIGFCKLLLEIKAEQNQNQTHER